MSILICSDALSSIPSSDRIARPSSLVRRCTRKRRAPRLNLNTCPPCHTCVHTGGRVQAIVRVSLTPPVCRRSHLHARPPTPFDRGSWPSDPHNLMIQSVRSFLNLRYVEKWIFFFFGGSCLTIKRIIQKIIKNLIFLTCLWWKDERSHVDYFNNSNNKLSVIKRKNYYVKWKKVWRKLLHIYLYIYVDNNEENLD